MKSGDPLPPSRDRQSGSDERPGPDTHPPADTPAEALTEVLTGHAPAADGPAADGPVVDGPVVDRSAVDGPVVDRSAAGEASAAGRPITVLAELTVGVVFRWAVAAALGVALVIGSLYAAYTVRTVLIQVFIALFAAVSLDPAVRWLVHRGIRRPIAVTVIFLLALGILVGFIWSVVPPLINQGVDLVDKLPDYADQLYERSETYRKFADENGLTDKITEYLGNLPAKIGPGAIGFVQQLLSTLFNLLLIIVLTIYFMADLPRLRRGAVRLAPQRHRPRVARVVDVMIDKVGGYMIGNIIISLFAGASTFICLSIAGVPFALPLAFFVALTDLIPMVGATIGAAGCVLVSIFTVDLWPDAVVVLLFFIAYQQLENYLIAPRVLKNTVDLSSVAVLVAALIGGTVLGVVGALMAIPIVAAGKVLMTPMVEAFDAQPLAERRSPSGVPPAEPPPPADADSGG